MNIWGSGHFQTAFKNLRMTKWRSLLTMMGVIIGISSVVTIVSLGEGLKHQVVGQISQLGSDVITVRSGRVNGGGSLNLLALVSSSTLTSRDVDSIARVNSVTDITPFDIVTDTVSTDGSSLNDVAVLGTSANINDLIKQKVSFGSFFAANDGSQHYAVIGSDVATRLFGVYNPTGSSFRIDGQDFIVEGVLTQSAGSFFSTTQTDINSTVFIPYQTALAMGGERGNIVQILAKAKDPGNVDGAVNDVHQTLERNHHGVDFSVLKQQQLLQLTGNIFNIVTGFVSAIAAISLLVGGIGIMDIMLVSVSERTREIGIRKAIGATNRQILNQFLVEGLVLTLFGGLIGVLASLAINFLLKYYSPWSPIISWPILIVAVLGSVAIGVIFSVAPAIKAARKDPIEALRA